MTLEQTILENFRELPTDKQQEVLDFIQFLKYQLLANKPLAISDKHDKQEFLTETQDFNDFWSALQNFRQRVDLESIDDTFENLRDNSPGREVNL